MSDYLTRIYQAAFSLSITALRSCLSALKLDRISATSSVSARTPLKKIAIGVVHLITSIIFPIVLLIIVARNLISKIATDSQVFEGKGFRTTNIRRSKNIFIFGPIDWDFRHQRPQQLTLSLLKLGYQIYYVNPTIGSRISRNPGFAHVRKNEINLININWMAKSKYIGVRPLSVNEGTLVARFYEDFLVKQGISSATVIFQQPGWGCVAEALSGNKIISDFMDLHSGFDNAPSEILALEKQLANNSEIIVVSSSILQTYLKEYLSSDSILIRNGVEISHFDSVNPTHENGRTIVGYFGAIAEWFDADLLQIVAKSLPNYEFQLIGRVSDASVTQKLVSIPNIQFIGEVNYQDLPSLVTGWNAGIIPFKITPLTLATNPVKVYEYSALGLPTVSTAMPEVAEISKETKSVQVARDSSEFTEALRNAIGISNAEKNQLRAWASGQSWDVRAKSLAPVIEQDPLVSVVVLMWNKAMMTIRCLSSIIERSDYSNLEIIVVDNASESAQSALVKNWIDQQHGVNFIYIRNDENLGFSAGNNVGLRIAKGEFIVLLNNDTEVTPGWLRRAIKHFKADPDLGILGPSTNNCGNEGRVLLRGRTEDWLSEVIPRFGFRPLTKFDTSTVAFFCVYIKREVLDKVGLMDEIYGRGYFEDDDYCRRVQQAGFGIAISRDIFIYHEMGASFRTLPSKEQQELFARNKKIYESKWGTWQSHKYAMDADQII